MASCEKCWSEARHRAMSDGRPTHEHYPIVMKEVEDGGRLCTPQEQAGQWWDEELQCDSRDKRRAEASRE